MSDYTIHAVAELFDVKPETIRYRVKKGRFPEPKGIGITHAATRRKGAIFDKDEVDDLKRWIDNDLVGYKEIAEWFGLSDVTIRLYARTKYPMPEPAYILDNRPMWEYWVVQDWASQFMECEED